MFQIWLDLYCLTHSMFTYVFYVSILMPNRQYTFSLPQEAGALIDAQPKSAKSQYVANALLLKAKFDAQEKLLTLLDGIEPQKGISDKSAVALVQEARNARAKQLIDNCNVDE